MAKKIREKKPEPAPTLTVNQSIPKYWTSKKDRNATRLVLLTEYTTKVTKKKKLTAPTFIHPMRMKISHLNQLTKIIALYGRQR